MADVRNSKDPGVDQNDEVSSTKPELCDNGPSRLPGGSHSDSRVKFGSGPLMGTPKNHFPLRTSLLGSSSAGKSGADSTPGRNVSFILNPPRLSNPFAKSDESTKTTEKAEKIDEDKIAESSTDETNKDSPNTPVKSKVENSRSSVSFVPLKCETPTQPSGVVPQSASPSLGFVFGENLHERVEASNAAENATNANKESESSSVSGETETKTNGTTLEMLFTTGVKRETHDKTTDGGGNKTLSEAAREYEEARAVKRKYEAVAVVTGEEEECNVVQMNCKLFAFDKCTCSWVERGRGTLRLNDLPAAAAPASRLIVRAAGSLRLVLNTKIWGGMSVGRASPKSLRLTAMDSSQVVKVFLIMASPKEIDQLQKALEWRVNNLKKAMDADDESPSKKTRSNEAVSS